MPASVVIQASRRMVQRDPLASATKGTQWSGAIAWKKATEIAEAKRIATKSS
jgi:hypothetical protein